MHVLLLHNLQSQGQLHFRQRSTGSGREPESQPLTTESEVRAELCMSFSGRSEGGGGMKEGRDHISHHKVLDHWTWYMNV